VTMTRTCILLVTLILCFTVAPVGASAPAPFVLAQATTTPPRDNSPAIPLPPQPAPRALTEPDKARPAPVPQPTKPERPHPDMTLPNKQVKRVPAPSPARPQKPHEKPGAILPRPAGGSDLGSTDVRRNQAVVLCNQRQLSCKNRCNSSTRGTTQSMCEKQCAALFQSCVNRANSRP